MPILIDEDPPHPAPFPPLWREGLAYCEAGRVIVAAASRFEIVEASISRGFGHPFNSWTRLGEVPNNTIEKAAFYYLSGEVAASYAPRFQELRLYHRSHRNMPSFTSGFRENRKVVKALAQPIWNQMGLADSTARTYTQDFFLAPVRRLLRENSAALHGVAQLLLRRGRALGPELLAEIKRSGGLTSVSGAEGVMPSAILD